MSTYKLTFFNIKGVGEPIRIIFAQAGVKYEDDRVSVEQWPDKKQSTPFGCLPVLEVDSKTELVGSLNILRYLGIKFGMAGKDELANAILGGASYYMSDIFAKITQFYRAKDDEKDKLLQEFKEKTGPDMLGTLQKHVKNGHINGSETISWVDIQCYNLLILWLIFLVLTLLTTLSSRNSLMMLLLNQTSRSGWRRDLKQSEGCSPKWPLCILQLNL